MFFCDCQKQILFKNTKGLFLFSRDKIARKKKKIRSIYDLKMDFDDKSNHWFV